MAREISNVSNIFTGLTGRFVDDKIGPATGLAAWL